MCLYYYVTCKDNVNVPVNFEAIGTIPVLLNRSWLELYLPKKKKWKTTTTMENYFTTGLEKQEIVYFSITTPVYDTELT